MINADQNFFVVPFHRTEDGHLVGTAPMLTSTKDAAIALARIQLEYADGAVAFITLPEHTGPARPIFAIGSVPRSFVIES